MNLFDSRPFLAIVFLCGVGGCCGALWVTYMRYVEEKSFPWELWLLGVFWFWGAWSTGKRLFGTQKKEPIQPPVPTREIGRAHV